MQLTNRDGQTITQEEETLILDSIRKWLDRDVRDQVLELEHADEYPYEMVEQMKALGLFGATISQVYGGMGLPSATYAKIVVAISEVWMSLTGIFNSHLSMAAAVERFATEAQKARLLPKFVTGELRGGLALTEPNCGTDLQAIRTRAVRDGDGYIINGT
ncbi:MAG: acyl-CoA dehydrogenase family protein, partial [Pseudomonadota bacterium]|nr:acyl-CoA dehydrogenase family protein [Pseudomonadota bacterium]